MSTLKKVLALTLAIAMVLSLNVFAAFKDQDKINEDCVDAMELMNALGIMLGDENGNANPTNTIKRAEAAAMIFRLMNKGSNDASIYEGAKVFTDVATGIWYDGYVNYAYTMGLVQGRTATTFDPNAPVTGYEIAKMLLVCTGYSAEKQAYTGANWYKNVQNDAFAAGMLENYGMALSAPAQRQWVAVMFADALNCTMVKYYLGELAEQDYTLGKKKFDFETATGVVVATPNITLENGSTSATKGKSTVMTSKGALTVKGTISDAMLGLEVNVYYKNNADKTLYGIAATGDSVLTKTVSSKMSAKIPTSGTNKDKVVVTVDGTEHVYAKNDKITVRYNEGYSSEMTAEAVKALLGTNTNFDVRFIDNSDVSYCKDIIDVTLVYYGQLTKSAADCLAAGDYGKLYVKFYNYKTAAIVDTNVAMGEDDTLTLDKTLAKNAYVKVTPAYTRTGVTYVVEAMTPVNGALTINRDNKLTIGGTKYSISLANYAVNTGALVLGNSYDVYTDGVNAIAVVTHSESVVTMPTNIALVLGAYREPDKYVANSYTYYVKVLTLDGKVTEYEYDPEDGLAWADVFRFKSSDMIAQYTINADGTLTFNEDWFTLPESVKTQKVGSSTATLNVSKATLDGCKVASDAKFFVKYTKSGDTKYAVMTLADFSANQNPTQLGYFYTINNGIKTIVMGAMQIGTIVTEVSDADYIIATSTKYDAWEDGGAVKKVDVIYNDGKEGTVTLDTTGVDPVANTLYTYTVSNGKAKFAAVEYDKTNKAIAGKSDSILNITGEGLVEMTDDVLVFVYNTDGDLVIGSMDDLYDVDDGGLTINYETNSKGLITLICEVKAD